MDETENDFSKYISVKNFDEPWHANLFALTVSLSESRIFSWPEWVSILSSKLASKNIKDDNSRDYFSVWLFSLEEVLLRKNQISKENLREVFKELVLAQNEPAH